MTKRLKLVILICAALSCGVGMGMVYLSSRHACLTRALVEHTRTIAQHEALLEKIAHSCSGFAPYLKSPLGVHGAAKFLVTLGQRCGLGALRVATLPPVCVTQARTWSLWRWPVRLSFSVDSDKKFWLFLGALARSHVGFVWSDFLSLERVPLSNTTIALKGRYHFSWFVFSKATGAPKASTSHTQSPSPLASPAESFGPVGLGH